MKTSILRLFYDKINSEKMVFERRQHDVVKSSSIRQKMMAKKLVLKRLQNDVVKWSSIRQKMMANNSLEKTSK